MAVIMTGITGMAEMMPDKTEIITEMNEKMAIRTELIIG